MDTIEFELVNNNYVVAGGDVWQRPGCIPMGGSFSAQSADLHCQWGVYEHRHLFRRLGQLHIGDSGFAYWDTPWGVLSLRQFRDNVLMATSFPDSPDIGIVAHIRSLLHTAWNLRVLCPCDDNCTHTCLQSHMTAMVYTMVCSDTHPHTAFVHPSSLTDTWAIKLGPPWSLPHQPTPSISREFSQGFCLMPWSGAQPPYPLCSVLPPGARSPLCPTTHTATSAVP